MKSTGSNDSRRWVRAGGALALLIVILFALYRAFGGGVNARDDGLPKQVEAKRALNGYVIKVEPDERVVYAGIRAPHANEPFFEEAKARNEKLIQDEDLRLRYDDEPRTKKGYLQAYVYVDGQFVNELLVREGLAYVRLTTGTRRFAQQLLAAQQDARQARRGFWQFATPSNEKEYVADAKYGNFHRPSCAEVGKIKPERLVTLRDKDHALNEGYAPCDKCLPF